jgi:hypothetical protein
MPHMSLQLTEEMRHALQAHPGQPVEVHDSQTQQVYVLVARDSFREMARDELLRDLQIGFDQAAAGRWVDWNPEAIKAEGRRRLQSAHAQ